jgi:membrane-bound metal-dependent hydrolase YbcI (DUF457 family)
VLLLAGVEQVRVSPGATAVMPIVLEHYPYSHSLLAVAVWAALFAGAYRAVRRDARGALWLAGAVLSHWVLDWISHAPDLPLYPGGQTRLGLGLWNSLGGTLLVEGGLFVVGVWLYARASQPRNRTGSYALWALVALLVVLYAGSLFGPPPPSEQAIAYGNLGGVLMVVWAYWIDRNRASRDPDLPPATAARSAA